MDIDRRQLIYYVEFVGIVKFVLPEYQFQLHNRINQALSFGVFMKIQITNL